MVLKRKNTKVCMNLWGSDSKLLKGKVDNQEEVEVRKNIFSSLTKKK